MNDALSNSNQEPHVCPHKFAIILDNPFRRLIQNPKKIVGKYVKEGDTVLDLGCGPGYFSIDMAKMVGPSGKIIAADIQAEMLAKAKRKATKHGVIDRMVFHQSQPSSIGYSGTIDFALMYYMIHESGDPQAILKETAGLLSPDGQILVVEPKMHVSQEIFDNMLKEAEEAGLSAVDFPENKGGRSALFRLIQKQ